jgi:hypothetical protein
LIVADAGYAVPGFEHIYLEVVRIAAEGDPGGAFNPATKTDAVNPGGRTMLGDKPGLTRSIPIPVTRPSYPLTLRQADKARADFVAISDDIDFIKSQLSRQPDRMWLSRMGLLGFGSVWAHWVCITKATPGSMWKRSATSRPRGRPTEAAPQ